MKKIPFLTLFALINMVCVAQEKDSVTTLSPELSRDILQKVLPDSTKMLLEVSEEACKCIDSIERLVGKGKADYNIEIKACIEEVAGSYQLSLLLINSMKNGERDIRYNPDKESPEYIRTYRSIEKVLRDSCESLKKVVATDDKVTGHSLTENKKAMEQYNKGVKLLKEENYKDAMPFFEKATDIDPMFAFAWDNVGICARRLGDYEKAVNAYKKSIAVDPEGQTPLQNLPVAYEYLKKYDEAIEAYSNLLKISPENPEVYYGSGRIWFIYKKDPEKALDDMCRAYLLYVKMNSAYRVDAEKMISAIYKEMKNQNKEDVFNAILKKHNIKTE